MKCGSDVGHKHNCKLNVNKILFTWFQNFAVSWILCVFFWVYPRRQIWRRGYIQKNIHKILFVYLQSQI
jgi:hypothetical protein